MIKTDYKSEYPIDYRLEIIEYFEKKRMSSYKKYLIKLFEVLPVRSLVHIYEKIQKQGKKPFVIEKFIDTYFDKYDIYSLISRPPLHKGHKCDMRFKSSLNSARLNLLNPYK